MPEPSQPALLAFLTLFTALALSLWQQGKRSSLVIGGLSLLLALASGLMTFPALLLVTPGLLLLIPVQSKHPCLHAAALVICGIWAFVTALHLLPGFSTLEWMTDFGRNADLTLRWHYDKGLAGLILLLALGPFGPGKPSHWLLLLPACAALPGLAMLAGLVSFDPRWQTGSAIWLAGNLFLTVFAEEAFFRGLLQGGLQKYLGQRIPHPVIVMLVALIFALVHLPRGAVFAAMALLAGLLYGAMAGRTRALPLAIAAHFLTNALFLLLTRSPLG